MGPGIPWLVEPIDRASCRRRLEAGDAGSPMQAAGVEGISSHLKVQQKAAMLPCKKFALGVWPFAANWSNHVKVGCRTETRGAPSLRCARASEPANRRRTRLNVRERHLPNRL